jgi:hypothetical protein
MSDEHDPRKDRKLLGWKAWYNDGRIFRSDEFNWEDIPQDGLTVLRRYYYDPRSSTKYGENWCGQDLYILDDDYRDKVLLPPTVKIGRWMADADFHPLFDEAKFDEEIIEEMI